MISPIFVTFFDNKNQFLNPLRTNIQMIDPYPSPCSLCAALASEPKILIKTILKKVKRLRPQCYNMETNFEEGLFAGLQNAIRGLSRCEKKEGHSCSQRMLQRIFSKLGLSTGQINSICWDIKRKQGQRAYQLWLLEQQIQKAADGIIDGRISVQNRQQSRLVSIQTITSISSPGQREAGNLQNANLSMAREMPERLQNERGNFQEELPQDEPLLFLMPVLFPCLP